MSGDKIDCDLPVKFSKVKSRSPQRNQSTRLDEFTEEVFLPLVAGDEFQEQELDGNFIFLSWFYVMLSYHYFLSCFLAICYKLTRKQLYLSVVMD